jgi:hypothetical protein
MICDNSNDESQRDSGLKRFYKRQSASCGHGRTLLGADQSARGLAQSKTLERMAMACVNAKRLGLRWPSTAFLPRRVSPTATQGSSFLTTLGWMTQSLWDSGSRQVNCAAARPFTQLAFPNGIKSNVAFKEKP